MAITLGPQFVINTQTSADQDNVSLAGLANGLFVAAYEAQFPAAPSLKNRVDLQVFNADGSKRGVETELLPSTLGHFKPDVAAAPDGTFHVAFETPLNGTRRIENVHRDIDGNSFTIGELSGLFDTDGDTSLAVRSDGGLFGGVPVLGDVEPASDPS